MKSNLTYFWKKGPFFSIFDKCGYKKSILEKTFITLERLKIFERNLE